jgi:methionine salvage enolase-phosphatase E1
MTASVRRSSRCKGRFGKKDTPAGNCAGSCIPTCRPRWSAGVGRREKSASIPREACWRRGCSSRRRLLFQTTTFGDLTSYIRDFFDTRIGEKADSESYKRIAALLDRAPREVLFLSDAWKEIEAASAAGLLTALCDRSRKLGGGKLGSTVIRSFDEVFLF